MNLQEITPPWLGFEVVTPRPIAMGTGALIEYRLKLHALPLGPNGRLARAVLVRRDLDRIFDYRRDAIAVRLGSP